MLLFALTVLVSSILLFMVQPIIAKQIVPWFGGSAGVWTMNSRMLDTSTVSANNSIRSALRPVAGHRQRSFECPQQASRWPWHLH